MPLEGGLQSELLRAPSLFALPACLYSSGPAMATILETIQKTRLLPPRPLKDELPTFGGGGGGGREESHLTGLRKRLSAFSSKIQPISSQGLPYR